LEGERTLSAEESRDLRWVSVNIMLKGWSASSEG
jgi:hypothetical protein